MRHSRQFKICNQLVDNITWVKGNHTLKFGFDGRKSISPQSFTRRVRGDYEYAALGDYLHDVSPTTFGEHSTGNFFYYGDQTAFYGYANDIWRVTPHLSLNYGLRYEFTSVPYGMREQRLNIAASVPGLITFHAPQPQDTNFAPRVGFAFAPDNGRTSRMSRRIIRVPRSITRTVSRWSSSGTFRTSGTTATGS